MADLVWGGEPCSFLQRPRRDRTTSRAYRPVALNPVRHGPRAGRVGKFFQLNPLSQFIL